MPTLIQYQRSLFESLKPLSHTAHLDAQVLLAHIVGKSRAWVLAHPEASLNARQADQLESSLARLQTGLPLPYVLGRWEFYSLQFTLTPDVLIPRPETELLVDQALDWLRRHPYRLRAADVGTGSGCIATILAYSRPALHLIATDISIRALRVAQANALAHGVENLVHFVQADLLSPFQHAGAQFDLLCANLPYVPTSTLQGLSVFGREPEQALDGGPFGLDLIDRLLAQAPGCLSPGGMLLLEIEASQGQAAQSLALQNFPAAEITVLSDLAGLDRLLRVQT